MSRTISIVGAKGGVGKTFVTLNLGKTLSALQRSVVIVEGDLLCNTADVAGKISEKLLYDLVDVIEGRCLIKSALFPIEGYPNLKLLPCVSVRRGNEVSAQNFRLVVKSLEKSFDYVIIDCPSGLAENFFKVYQETGETVVVVDQSVEGALLSKKMIDRIHNFRLNSLGFVLNKKGETKGGINAAELSEYLSLPPLAEVPYGKSDHKKSFSILSENVHFSTNVLNKDRKIGNKFWGIFKWRRN